MKNLFLLIKDCIYTSFWVLPLLMAINGGLLAVLAFSIDSLLTSTATRLEFSNYISMINASNTLPLIATAIITITSVTFSITILTLSIVSTQYGARLLPGFLRQKPTQFVLGSFIGVFIYILAVSMLMPASDISILNPYFSVVLALILGVISFLLLIYFIHFVCKQIQLDTVLEIITTDLVKAINTQYTTTDDENLVARNVIGDDINNRLHSLRSTDVLAKKTGYIQIINYQKLFSIADKNELVIIVHENIGKFAIEGAALFSVYTSNSTNVEFDDEILSVLQVGKRRAAVQDIEFFFEELSEIVLTALSPGINNSYIAIHTIDRIAQGILELSKHKLPSKYIFSKDGDLRLVRHVVGYGNFVETAFNQIRQNAVGNMGVVIHVFHAIRRLLSCELPDELAMSLKKQVNYLYESTAATGLHQADRQDLKKAYDAAME